MADRVDIAIPNDREALPRIVAAVEELVERSGVSPDIAFALDLAIDEIVTNIISYGYPDGGAGTISLAMVVSDEDVRLEISDDAVPFDPLKQERDPPLEGSIEDRPIGGLGLHLVQNLMDEVSYRRADGRNHLTCVKKR